MTENNSTTIDRNPSTIEVSGHSSVDNTSTKYFLTTFDKRQGIVGSSIARESMTKVYNEER